ncbi:MAG TPA: CheR family methyltransferase [Burkholderiales bacterium]|nr:CheR family methyltransferase [Burkholderiales bacterium]
MREEASVIPDATLETDLLIEALSRTYGLDPGHYSPAACQAWAVELARATGASSVYALIEKLVEDREFGARAIEALSDEAVRLFDDPYYWRLLRERVLPWLRTTPFLSVWLPECGAGGAIYSWAVLLEEVGLTARTRIYATDAKGEYVREAARASFSSRVLADAQKAYEAAGGTDSIIACFDVKEKRLDLTQRLRMQVTWLQFDPAQGESFNEFHFIDGRFLSAESPRHAFKLMVGSLPISGLIALHPSYGRALMQHNLNFKEWQHGVYQRIA